MGVVQQRSGMADLQPMFPSIPREWHWIAAAMCIFQITLAPEYGASTDPPAPLLQSQVTAPLASMVTEDLPSMPV